RARASCARARFAPSLGWPVTVHAILDSSVGRVLDAMETVAREHPIASLRWNICHAECIGPENLERVRQLGIALALQSHLEQGAADERVRRPRPRAHR